MKFKLIAVLLGLTMAIPGAVFAQNQNDQAPDPYSKPSPNIQAPMSGSNGVGNDQGAMGQDDADQDSAMGQGATGQGSMNQAPPAGPNDPGFNNSDSGNAGPEPSYNTPAPAETAAWHASA